MARGGKRTGAGRPKGTKKLRINKRMAICARYLQLWRKECKINEEREILNKTFHVSEEHKEAKKVKVKERKEWLESDKGQEHLDNVELARCEDQMSVCQT